jgi:hypothetical protein
MSSPCGVGVDHSLLSLLHSGVVGVGTLKELDVIGRHEVSAWFDVAMQVETLVNGDELKRRTCRRQALN